LFHHQRTVIVFNNPLIDQCLKCRSLFSEAQLNIFRWLVLSQTQRCEFTIMKNWKHVRSCCQRRFKQLINYQNGQINSQLINQLVLVSMGPTGGSSGRGHGERHSLGQCLMTSWTLLDSDGDSGRFLSGDLNASRGFRWGGNGTISQSVCNSWGVGGGGGLYISVLYHSLVSESWLLVLYLMKRVYFD